MNKGMKVEDRLYETPIKSYEKKVKSEINKR